MNVILEPVLVDCRAIYDLEDVMERYWAYVDLMTKKRGEFLPLGAFSPMGKRQKDFLDGLLVLEAEDFAAKICQQASQAILEPLLNSTDYPTNFAAMYGDEAAKSVGFSPLGLSSRAGFALGASLGAFNSSSNDPA